MDLYLNISQNITLTLVGKNEVHLSGYFEPNNSVEDQLYNDSLDDEDDEDEEDELSEDDEEISGKKRNPTGLDKNLKAAQKNALKNVMNDEDDEDDEEQGSSLDDIDLLAEEGEDEELESD